METWQILWGVNTFFLGVVGFLYKLNRDDNKRLRDEIREEIKQIKEEIKLIGQVLEGKQGWRVCDKIHEDLKKHLHLHGTLGTAGEVIR
jgi:hypothetical protein